MPTTRAPTTHHPIDLIPHHAITQTLASYQKLYGNESAAKGEMTLADFTALFSR